MMSLQLVNTTHPNSIHISFLFSVFRARDTTSNLLVAPERYRT